MTATRTYICEYCKKRWEEYVKKAYGKVSVSEYNRLFKAKKVEDIPEDFGIINRERIEDNLLNFEFIEDYGDSIYVDEDGTLIIDISAECAMCGNQYSYNFLLPPNDNIKIVDMREAD